MPMPRNLHWNPVAQRWESRGRDGLVKAYIGESGLGADNVTVGTALALGGGSNIAYVLSFTGTSGILAAIGSAGVARATGTITNATGLAAGDKVFGVPRTALSTTVGVTGFHVPTTNTLNVYIQNLDNASAGSLAATGWDVVAIRTT